MRKYVYYNCIKKIGVNCKQPYIREEMMLENIIRLLDDLEFEETETIKKYKKEVERMNKFNNAVGVTKKKIKAQDINIQSYAKYVLNEGTKEEKREILGGLKTPLILLDGKIKIK